MQAHTRQISEQECTTHALFLIVRDTAENGVDLYTLMRVNY